MFGPHVPAITADQVPADAFLLDVREDDEWAAGHVPEALHVPMMEIPVRADGEVPTDRDVVVVCRSGQRSAQVTAFLLRSGWTRVANLSGGMFDWVTAGRPIVSEDGGAARVA